MSQPAQVPFGAPATGPDGAIQRVRIAAYGWIERDDAVLLVRIAPGEMGAGLWTLPGGGLAFGEDPALGVIREVAEETGLHGTIGALLGVRSAVLEPAQTKSGQRVQAIGLLYRVAVARGALRHEIDESTDLAAWMAFNELDDLPQVPLIAWARDLGGR